MPARGKMGLQEIERLQIPTPESFLPLYFQLNLGSCQGKGSAGLARCAVKHVCKALALLMADLPDAGTPRILAWFPVPLQIGGL